MTSPYNKFNQFVQDVAHQVHNLNVSEDELKVVLTNVLPVNTNSVLANITQIPAGNGYSTGGIPTTITSSVQTSGIFKIKCANVVFMADGGTIGPFRYTVLYNNTPVSPLAPLIAWWDYGAPLTLNDTETFSVAFDQANGAFTLT